MAVVAFLCAGSAQAGCGDYLDGGSGAMKAGHGPMAPDHGKPCLTCGERQPPLAPVPAPPLFRTAGELHDSTFALPPQTSHSATFGHADSRGGPVHLPFQLDRPPRA